ncbi:hypothetical protein M2135_002893 [Parabacteroides sp. PF5-9]|nr:hypothetical protein [Parabacteroides sp. PF5-9]
MENKSEHQAFEVTVWSQLVFKLKIRDEIVVILDRKTEK